MYRINVSTVRHISVLWLADWAGKMQYHKSDRKCTAILLLVGLVHGQQIEVLLQYTGSSDTCWYIAIMRHLPISHNFNEFGTELITVMCSKCLFKSIQVIRISVCKRLASVHEDFDSQTTFRVHTTILVTEVREGAQESYPQQFSEETSLFRKLSVKVTEDSYC